MVFAEISGPSSTDHSHHSNSLKSHHINDLEDEYGLTTPNEGEAAEQGIYYDDTKYNYMQHMRDLGSGGNQATWLDAPKKAKGKDKAKVGLDAALQALDLEGNEASDIQSVSVASTSRSLLPEDAMASEFVVKRTYQDQQDVPDELAGFQPDMDPRLREVLEALENDAYVDDEDEIFAELAEDEVVDAEEWEDSYYNGAELDDGWESDDTVKAVPVTQRRQAPSQQAATTVIPPPEDTMAAPPEDPEDGAWLAEFSKFKKDLKSGAAPGVPSPAQAPSQITGLSSLASTRHKKRKGAKTSTTNYSMTSSALARTEAQTLLDARFDKLLDTYDQGDLDTLSEVDEHDHEHAHGGGCCSGHDMDDTASVASAATRTSNVSRRSHASNVSGMSRASGVSTYSRMTDLEAPTHMRSDFDGILDGFLAGHSLTGKKGRERVKRGFRQTPLQEMDEMRAELGPARIRHKQTV